MGTNNLLITCLRFAEWLSGNKDRCAGLACGSLCIRKEILECSMNDSINHGRYCPAVREISTDINYTLDTEWRLTAPRIIQPLLFPQLQSPLLDKVNCKVLGRRNKIDALRILDPIHHHLHIVYLILLLLGRSWAAILCSQVPLKFVHAITSPCASCIGTE